jgi:hypothetical protein
VIKLHNLQSYQSLLNSLKAPTKPTKPTPKPPKPSPASSSTAPSILDDIIGQLCTQTEELDIEEEDPKAKKKAKAAEIARLTSRGLEGVMEEVKPLKDVQFEPFKPGIYREPEVNIPSNIDLTDPLALLDLFIPPERFTTIAENTNLYAIAHNAPTKPTPTNRRYWRPTNENEIHVLFGIFIYMSVHREPNHTIYWETSKPKLDGPNHTIPQHMSLNRYENLRRYLHLSPPKNPNSQTETEEEEEKEEEWWWRLDPLFTVFRTACQTCLIPGTAVAIDEIMVRFHGRSSDTCKMPKKPIKQGYKIFVLADDGYVWHFQLSSKQFGIGELSKVDELTATGSMVLQMARLLPKIPNSHYILYLDNYSTSIPLFSTLQKENIGAAGTRRPSGTDFPALLIVLRRNWPSKLEWGTTIADIVDDVLCIGWQDNNFVLGLSTVHTVHEASSWVTSKRNRPSETSTNAITAREVFGDLPFMNLDIPAFINDYNHNMNSVDLANQHRQPYNTQRIAYRTWIPLLHWILDQAAINAYKIAIISKTLPKNKLSHLKFQRRLYQRLLDYSKLMDHQPLQLQLWKEPGPHNWVVRPVRQRCAMCTEEERLKEILIQHKDRRTALLKGITNSQVKNINKSQSGCGFCDIALCKTGSCFQDWHSQ